ncbi:Variable major outer membrane lipoprotein [Borrelia duttonii CR2A]|uniref:Variable major outer membrane lipoprotein n=1 Tax=Borrelia duttonii CR2A TaxID=1432657 RepID=W6TW05_9SPIR|nr:Variable major outer membrane lipoprotein [Borrelia duttonii CR2A]
MEEMAKKIRGRCWCKGEESKDGKNAIRDAIDQAKGVLGKLKGYLESLKGIG